MSCSSHSPPLSHTGQSSGWLVRRNSSMYLRAWRTWSVSVRTTMPSVATSVQAVCSLGAFSTYKAHAASSLERQPGVIAEGGHFGAQPPRRFNDQRALGHLNFAVVHLSLMS